MNQAPKNHSEPQASIKTRFVFYSILVFIPLVLVVFRAGQSLREKTNLRQPASLDLSHLDGDSFVRAARLRMIEGLAVQAQDGQHLVTAGHFQDDGGSICKSYSKIEYIFAADDSVVSGEPIIMSVRGDCMSDSDASQLSYLEIPYRKVLIEKPGDITIAVLDRNKTEVLFSNVGDSWPRSWSLKSVRLLGANQQIVVAAKEIFSFRGRPLQLSWPR